MIKINDGVQSKRVSGKPGDRVPLSGIKRDRAVFVAAGGETTLSLNTLSPAITYIPGNTQLQLTSSVKGSMISGLDYFETTATSLTFPEALLAGEWLEVVKSAEITGVMAATPRPDMYSAVGVLGQTLVTADFSWTYNLNSTKAVGAVEVYLHGVLQTRGVDYTEVSLGTTNTNQILFVDALLGGENIVLKPTYMVIDQSAQASTFNSQQLAGIQSGMTAGFQGFVDQSALISVPSTTIVGRAKIPNLAADLRASMGIDRIMTQVIVELQNEFGPAGERVFGVLNDDRGLIRFVGNWNVPNDADGSRAQTPATTALTDYAEITFFGTALNMIGYVGGTARNVTVSIDGGSASTVVNNGSGVIATRNYNQNNVIPLVSGLTLGVHTAKIQGASAAAIPFYGFEVINASASVVVNPGTAYNNGQKLTLANAASLAFNTGVTGTRGGRQLVYLTSAGVVANAFQAVNAAQANLTSADHTNEEMSRLYNWREFGAGRTDDFSSTLSAANRAFTLDDGTTTLIGSQLDSYTTLDGLRLGTLNCYMTFIFVGTGLDILRFDDSATVTADTVSVFVDGVSIGSLSTVASPINPRTDKIVSGLPYGTHTLKLLFTASGGSGRVSVKAFRVYQPKKPALPANAVELADYNVMATYVASTTVIAGVVAQGSLRKAGAREHTYSGTWTIGLDSVSFDTGFNIATTAAASYAEYTFFGTGFEHGSFGNNAADNYTYSVDGSTNLSAYTTSTVVSAGTWTIVPSTGVASGTPNGRMKTIVSGLPLGIHKVRITFNSGSALYLDYLDIITPIHSAKSNLYGDLQNTLMVGSQGISDNRKTSAIKEILPATKAWAQAIGITSGPTTTGSAAVPCPDLSITQRNESGRIRISYSCITTTPGSGTNVFFQVYVNGSSVGVVKGVNGAAGYYTEASDTFTTVVPKGVNKIDVYWYVSGGITLTASTTMRNLLVEEV